MKHRISQLLMRIILKLIFSCNQRYSDKICKQVFELYIDHEVSFLYILYKLQEI